MVEKIFEESEHFLHCYFGYYEYEASKYIWRETRKKMALEEKNVEFAQTDLPELLAQYYQRLFPYSEFYRWLSYGNVQKTYFQRREFSFTLKDDVYVRYLSFLNEEEMVKEIQKRQPYKIDIGAVYSTMPKDHKAVKIGGFVPEEKELVFDIDMTDYDEVRTCCSGASICKKCWPFMTIAIKILDRALEEDFGFKHRLWVYSGRRGVHCWVCDEQARKLSQNSRSGIVEYLSLIKGGENQVKKVNFGKNVHPSIQAALKFVSRFFTEGYLQYQGILDTPERWKSFLSVIPDESIRDKMHKLWSGHSSDVSSKEKWDELKKELNSRANRNTADEIMCQYVYPRLDINVSKGINHLLKSPFCVHPKTGRVCVPIDVKKVDEFDPFAVPTISTLCNEIDRFEKKQDQLANHEMDVDESNPVKPQYKAYEKTSLAESVRVFQKFIAALQRDMARKNEGEQNLCDW